MNIFDALTKHHYEILDLFSEAEDSPENYAQLKLHLSLHHELEEELLFEPTKDEPNLKRKTLEAIEEHRVIEMMLIDIGDFPRDNERWPIKLHVMKEFVKHHFDEEEHETFASGREEVDKEMAKKMGKRFLDRKEGRLSLND